MCSSALVSLFVCKQDYAKTILLIFTIFGDVWATEEIVRFWW